MVLLEFNDDLLGSVEVSAWEDSAERPLIDLLVDEILVKQD